MNKKYLIIGTLIIALLMNTNIASGAYSSLLALLKKLEENNHAALTAYDDGYGNWTIGYGSIYNYDLNRRVQKGDTIDQSTADRFLQIEASKMMNDVKKLVLVPINDNQLIALSSFAYNLGVEALRDSTLLRLLNNGTDINTVAGQFLAWNKARNKYTGQLEFSQGLYNRRVAEKNLFLS
jgi:lysozyme